MVFWEANDEVEGDSSAILPQSDYGRVDTRLSFAKPPPSTQMPLLSLVKPDAVDELRKTRVVTHSIRERLYFEPLQDIGLLLVGALKPGKHFIVVAKADISLNERSSRNVTLLPTSIQLVNQAKSLRTSAGMPARTPWPAHRSRRDFYE
jgi:hypothetical protein